MGLSVSKEINTVVESSPKGEVEVKAESYQQIIPSDQVILSTNHDSIF